MPLAGILVYLFIDSVIYLLRPFSELRMEWYATLMITGANGLAACALIVFKPIQDEPPVWRWFARGIFIAFLAHCSAIAITLLLQRPFAWKIADDVLLLIAHAFIVWGLWRWGQIALSDPETPSDTGQSSATIATVFMFFFTAICVMVPAFGLWGDPAYERAVHTLLNLFDILGFLFCIRIFFYHQKQRAYSFSSPIYVFSLGFGLLCLANPFAQFQTLLGAELTYHWINIAWVLGYLLISNAAWQRRRK
ncbi:MAG: hypothetical protein P9L94_18415 [Candidatus Hinthialibacter antarcticus]|nr:hypothetical protein [Candidatus Hinthialibacter antarcticus]